MGSTVNIHEAKTQLSRLVARAEAGEVIVIARAGVPVADLVVHQHLVAQPRTGRGAWAGLVDMSDFGAFDEEIASDFHRE